MSFILWWRGEGNITKRPKKKPWRKGQSRSWTFFCFINILQIFSANYLLISSITFTLSFFFHAFFTPTFTHTHTEHTHDPGPLSTSHDSYAEFLLRLRKKFQISKKRLIDRGSPQTLIENLLSCMKFTDRECAKHSNKEDKRNSVFRDTVPALSVYFKGRFNEKMESYTILLRQIF